MKIRNIIKILTESNELKDIDTNSVETNTAVSGYLYHGSRTDDLEEIETRNPPYSGGLGSAVYMAEYEEAENYGDYVYRIPVSFKKPFNLDPQYIADHNGEVSEDLLYELKNKGINFEEWAGSEVEYERPFGSWNDNIKEKNGKYFMPKDFTDWVKKNSLEKYKKLNEHLSFLYYYDNWKKGDMFHNVNESVYLKNKERIVLKEDMEVYHGTMSDMAEKIQIDGKLKSNSQKISGGHLYEKGLIWFACDIRHAEHYALGIERRDKEGLKNGSIFKHVITKGTKLINRYAELTKKEAEEINKINKRPYDPIKEGTHLESAMNKLWQYTGFKHGYDYVLKLIGYDGVFFDNGKQIGLAKDSVAVSLVKSVEELNEESKHIGNLRNKYKEAFEFIDELFESWPENNIPMIGMDSILPGESVSPFWFEIGGEIHGIFNSSSMEDIANIVSENGYDALLVRGLRAGRSSFNNHEVLAFQTQIPDMIFHKKYFPKGKKIDKLGDLK